MDELARLKAAGFSDQEIRLHQAGFSDAEIQAHIATPAPDNSHGGGIGDWWRRTGDNARSAVAAFGHDVADANADKGVIPNPLKLAKPVMDAASFAVAPYKAAADTVLAPVFGDKPVALPFGINKNGMTAGDIALGAVPLAGAGVRKAAEAAEAIGALKPKQAIDATKGAIKNVTGAERRATAAAGTMRNAAQVDYSTAKAAADAQATADADQAGTATTQAQKASDIAARAKARQAVLMARQGEAARNSALPEPAVGAPAQLSDSAAPVRAAALAKQDEIDAAMHEGDTKYRAAMDAVNSEQAAKGVGVSDMDTAKALLRRSEALVNPDPTTRPDVGPVLAAKAGGNLHQELLDTLKPEKVVLSPDEAKAAVKAGVSVYKGPQGPYRLNKPDFKTVDDFRRHVGEVLNGKAEGYNTIQQAAARDMYAGLTRTLDEYTQGTSAPVQENWKAAKKALEPFERVRAGQAIVGTQRGVSAASVPAASLPGRIMAGGRDTVNQAISVAGEDPVRAMVRTQAQTALEGAKGSQAIAEKVGPGTKLGDVISADPSLEAAVQQHMANTKAAEAQGALAKGLGSRVATTGSRADALTKRAGQLNKVAEALQGSSAKAASTADTYARSLANLEIADPKSVGGMYTSMLEDAHKFGRISIKQYQAGRQLAARAQSDFALKASRDKWLRTAGLLLGGGVAASAGVSGVHSVASKLLP